MHVHLCSVHEAKEIIICDVLSSGKLQAMHGRVYCQYNIGIIYVFSIVYCLYSLDQWFPDTKFQIQCYTIFFQDYLRCILEFRCVTKLISRGTEEEYLFEGYLKIDGPLGNTV